eukprot:5480455-Alexandrium_andersonii.AAC.1
MARVAVFLELPSCRASSSRMNASSLAIAAARSAFVACCRRNSAAVALASMDVANRPSGANVAEASNNN